MGNSIRKTLFRFFMLLIVRTFSAGFFALVSMLSFGEKSDWTFLLDSLVQILVFMGTFIVFYRFLFKLKTVQIQINPALESAEEVMDELVKVQRRVKFVTIMIVFGFLTMIMVTVIFSSLNLYKYDSIRNIGAIINIAVCLPSQLCMIYFLFYFIKMGDDFV